MTLGIALGTVFWTVGVLSTPSAWAREDRIPGSRYTSLRAAGMADSALPLMEDPASALFYQPAAIGKFRKAHFEPVNLSMGFPSGFFPMIDMNVFNVSSLDRFAQTLQNNPGKWGGLSGQIVPSIQLPYFSAAVLVSADQAARVDNDVLRYRSRYQLIPAVGTGASLAHGVIRVGYSLQWVNASFNDVTPSAAPYSYSEGMRQGAAFSHTLGLAFTLPYTYLPQLNVVWRNVARARYNAPVLMSIGSGSPGAPADDPSSFDFSFSMSPRIAGNSFLTWVLSYRDALNASGTSALSRVALGIEIDIKKSFFLRGGFGSGYPSAGFGYRGTRSEFSIAWFAEELGTGFRDQDLRKVMMQFQLRAF